eukprot:754402-Hanusia_phi.AAC.8
MAAMSSLYATTPLPSWSAICSRKEHSALLNGTLCVLRAVTSSWRSGTDQMGSGEKEKRGEEARSTGEDDERTKREVGREGKGREEERAGTYGAADASTSVHIVLAEDLLVSQ